LKAGMLSSIDKVYQVLEQIEPPLMTFV